MLRHIHIGPAVLQTALVLYLIGFSLALEAIRRSAPRHNLNSNRVQNITMLGFIMGLLAARITYALDHWAAYRDDWQAWVSFTPQGLNVIGGIAGAALVMGLAVWRYQIPVRAFLDTLAPGMGIILVLIPLAFLAEGSIIGKPTSLPWAIDLWGQSRHPSQLYASLGGIVTLGAWWFYRPVMRGAGFLIICIGNAITWLVVGLLLAEPSLIFDQYRLVQIGAWLILITSVLLWNIWHDQTRPT